MNLDTLYANYFVVISGYLGSVPPFRNDYDVNCAGFLGFGITPYVPGVFSLMSQVEDNRFVPYINEWDSEALGMEQPTNEQLMEVALQTGQTVMADQLATTYPSYLAAYSTEAPKTYLVYLLVKSICINNLEYTEETFDTLFESIFDNWCQTQVPVTVIPD